MIADNKSNDKPNEKSNNISNSIIVSLNGEFVSAGDASISIFDSGLLSGFGVFETILAKDGQPFRLAEHLARFEISCDALNLQCRFTETEIERFACAAFEEFAALQLESEGYCRMRITLSGGNSGNGLWGDASFDGSLIIIVQDHVLPDENNKLEAEIVLTATPLHWLAEHKTLSRMLHSHPAPLGGGKSSGKRNQLQLFFNPEVGVTEFGFASLFVRKGSNVIVAPRDSVFPGICRTEILRHWSSIAPEFKLAFRKLEIRDLLEADEVIGVNSLRAAFALSQVSDRTSETANSVVYNKPVLSPRLRSFLLTR